MSRATIRDRAKLRLLAQNLRSTGSRIFVFFTAFTTLGYILINLLPSRVFTGLLGGDSAFAVVLMAVLGIPIYLSSDASLPLVASLINNGVGQGAAMAFLVTGAGTSLAAISGSLIIARWRVVGLVVGILFVGALVMGFSAQALLDS